MRKDNKKKGKSDLTAERKGIPLWACRAAFFVASWGAFWGLARWTCAYALCARGQMWSWLGDADPQGLWGVGGMARAAGLRMGSLMTTPAVASAVLATLAAFTSLFMLLIMRRISKGALWTAPLSLCPGVAMTLMLGNVYVPLSTPIALTVALGCGCACLLFRRWWMVAAAAVVLGVAVTYFCGPWLMPGASYVPWLGKGATSAPLTGVCISLAAAALGRFLNAKKNWLRIFCTAASCVVLLIFSFNLYVKPVEEGVFELSYYASRGEWGKIERRCKSLPIADYTEMQNYWSLAMAEQGKLADCLFAQPWVHPRSLIDLSQRSPVEYMLFSDIYYSMGQIGLAQRYAFEANEALGNSSPRMLKRLADTNIAYGQYGVAEKCLRLLDKAGADGSWLADRRALLNDDTAVEAHRELGPKRRCIPSDDRFAFDPAIEPDLLETLRANPEHYSTMQYLGCIYLLGKNVPMFSELIVEFYGTPALPYPLPQHFQEGVAMASLASGDDLASKCDIEPSMMQACQAFWSKRQQFDQSCWHYIRDYKPVDK